MAPCSGLQKSLSGLFRSPSLPHLPTGFCVFSGTCPLSGVSGVLSLSASAGIGSFRSPLPVPPRAWSLAPDPPSVRRSPAPCLTPLFGRLSARCPEQALLPVWLTCRKALWFMLAQVLPSLAPSPCRLSPCLPGGRQTLLTSSPAGRAGFRGRVYPVSTPASPSSCRLGPFTPLRRLQLIGLRPDIACPQISHPFGLKRFLPYNFSFLVLLICFLTCGLFLLAHVWSQWEV